MCRNAQGTGAAMRRLRSLRDLGKRETCAWLTGGGVCPFGAALAPGYFLSRLRREGGMWKNRAQL